MSTFERTSESEGVRDRVRVSDIVTTTNATQQTAFQIPVPVNTCFRIDVYCLVRKSDNSGMAIITESVGFRRVAGNVIRATGSSGLLKPLTDVVGDLPTTPDMDIVANTTDQTIDIKVTGIASTTLNWALRIETLRFL